MSIESFGPGAEDKEESQPQEGFEDYQKRKMKEVEAELSPGEIIARAKVIEEFNTKVRENNKKPTTRAEKKEERRLKERFSREIPEILRRDGREEKERLDGLFAEFEDGGKHSLEDLNNITIISPELVSLMIKSRELIAKGNYDELELAVANLSPEEAGKYRIREAAKSELDLIQTLLRILEKETTISTEDYLVLNAKYNQISKAVGMININGNRVDH